MQAIFRFLHDMQFGCSPCQVTKSARLGLVMHLGVRLTPHFFFLERQAEHTGFSRAELAAGIAIDETAGIFVLGQSTEVVEVMKSDSKFSSMPAADDRRLRLLNSRDHIFLATQCPQNHL